MIFFFIMIKYSLSIASIFDNYQFNKDGNEERRESF
jgi:hypothetical protein